MENRFYSKVDWWIGTLLGGVILFQIVDIVRALLNKPSLYTLLSILCVVFLSWILFGTYYEFRDDYLLVRSGPFKDEILYSDIKKINFKKSPIASLALSVDRIELICYSKFGGYVSPKHKDEFVEILQSKSKII